VLGCSPPGTDDDFCRERSGFQVLREKSRATGSMSTAVRSASAIGRRQRQSHRVHLVNAMKRLGYKRGIATECIGGGQGGAMLIEAV